MLFSIAFFGQQSWSTLVMIVPTDLFERRVVASVAGLVGFGGAMGGLVMNLVVGRLLDRGFGYRPCSRIVGTAARDGVRRDPADDRIERPRVEPVAPERTHMKITEIRTRVVEWRGKTVSAAAALLHQPDGPAAICPARLPMGGFRFHGWLIVEMFTDTGLVGIGNAALSPRVTKQMIDLYLKPLLIGAIRSTSSFSGSTCTARRWRSAARASPWWRSARWTSRSGTSSGRPRSSRCSGCSAAAPSSDSGVRQPALQPAAGRAGGRGAERTRMRATAR